MALAVWAFLRPEPYALCMALVAAAPLLALVLMATGRGRVVLVEADEAAGREALTGLFFPPALALGYRAMIDIYPLDRLAPLLAAGAVAAVVSLAVIVFLLERRRFWLCVGVAVTSFAYGWGLALEGNSLLRPATTGFVYRQVADKREVGDDGYWVRLAPPYPGVPAEVAVSPEMYRAIGEGDELCIQVHRGAFGWRWWEVGFCPA